MSPPDPSARGGGDGAVRSGAPSVCDCCGAGPERWERTWPQAGPGDPTMSFVTCRACGLTFSTAPPAEDLVAFHREQYAERAAGRPAASGAHDPGRMREKHYSARYQRKARQMLRRAAALRADRRRPARVLEVGCAAGGVLKAARDLGYAATGVEVSPLAAEPGLREHGLDIRIGRLEDQAFPEGAFDLILLYDIIEHVTAPSSLLAECARALAPGGVLAVHTICGSSSWTARVWGPRYFMADPGWGHVVLYSPAVLRRYCARLGLEPVRLWTHGFRAVRAPRGRRLTWWKRMWIRPVENLAHHLARLAGRGHGVHLLARKKARPVRAASG